MQVIPVLDLLGAHAVRAVRGERARYRPIESSLCATSEPLDVAQALLAATAARTLYVADLGAILEQADHAGLLAALCRGLPRDIGPLELWVDAGFTDFASMHDYLARIRVDDARVRLVPVFGTESLREPSALHEASHAGLDPILSLDHRAGCLIAEPGVADLIDSILTSRVIVMTLDQVGSYQGPDLATFASIQARTRARSLTGAGGIRDAADLALAATSGAQAWLVASALHDRQLRL